MEVITPTRLYALKNTNLLSIPKSIQDIIATMQLAPVSQIFKKKPNFKAPRHGHERGNWRHTVLVELKATVLKKDDPDYELVVGITNKASNATVATAAKAISEIITRRVEEPDMFRLRVVNLLFSRGVSMPFFSKMMANIFELVHSAHPDVKEDLQVSCSTETFNTLFDMTTTIVFPESGSPGYEDSICEWNKKREIRRGFGIFATELHLRGLVDEETIKTAISTSIAELDESIRLPADKIVSESVDQLVTFLFESSKVLLSRFGKTHPICRIIALKAKEIYALPKEQTPCLCMRSRFKMDDMSRS
jgi:hypothetical protein